MTELYKKYRPKKFNEIIGQTEAVKILTDLGIKGEIPHAILMSGPSGTGKTTLARILRKKLKCSDADYVEMNAADARGIDAIRDISQRVGSAPIGGRTRVWVVDEVHGLTSQAQDSFLKLLEDTPKHAYFVLLTTDPQKLKKTIRTRCTEIKCNLLTDVEVNSLVSSVAEKEGIPLDHSVIEKITEVAEGSARKALVLLHSIMGEDEADKQIELIEKASTSRQAIEICRALMNSKTSWTDMRKILLEVEDDSEAIRRMVMGYAKAVLLKSGNPRAAVILDYFVDHFYDSGQSGLVLACWNVIKSPAF